MREGLAYGDALRGATCPSPGCSHTGFGSLNVARGDRSRWPSAESVIFGETMRRVNGGRFAGPTDDPDRYELHECCGGGGEGEVWRAERRLDDGHVAEFAVKVGKETDVETARRLADRWETQAVRLRSLSHPALVRVQEAFFGADPHRAGDASGAPTTPYFIMEWVEGEQLHTWAATEPKASRRLAVLDTIGSALDELHAAGFVHADVKPENILVSQRATATGSVIFRAVLVDFGLMRSLKAAPPTQNMGTPGFVSPEGLKGLYEPASDLYGLAATVFVLLTGTRAPLGSDVRDEVRGRLLGAGLEPRAADVIVGGFHPDPAARLGGSASIVAWLAALRGALSSTDQARLDFMPTQPVAIPRRRGRQAALAAAAIVLVGATALATNALGNGDERAGDRSANDASAANISPETTEASTTTTTEPTTTTTLPPTTTRTRPPEKVFLAQHSEMQVEGSGGGKASIAGVPYSWSLRTALASCSGNDWTSVWEYTLGRDYTRLTAVAGVDDFSSEDTVMRFRVLLDGREILNEEGRRNQAFRIDEEDVGGVNHVRFEVTATRDLCGTLSNKKDIGAFGDPFVT